MQRCVTSLSTSSNVPGSKSRSIRSRAVSLPCSCCFLQALLAAAELGDARLERLDRGSLEIGVHRSASLDARVAERADALDLHHHAIAGHERTDARRRAGRDDVARVERQKRDDELDQLRHREDQLMRVRRLPLLAVDPALDREVGRIEPDGDARTDRRERVEALGARVLHVLGLQLARGHVVEAGDAEHVVHRVGGFDARRAAADHHRHLRLVIDAAGPRRDANRLLRADDGRRRL